MKRPGRKSETAKLGETVKALPKRVADWTPEQRRQFTEQSDRAMHEQNGTGAPAQPRGFFRRG
ncbi:hypothetical protein [Streptomyces sp. DH20]|uniref:hypothetical protein n=1 Tax=Streptomyces sp. DH20 TaxID=2857009 RepID=UPI001E2D8443|nr:hypothetical protein [Streptomyces sp. DH20]